MAYPQLLNNQGTYDFKLLTCMEVGPSYQRYCETTAFSALIADPCEYTELIAEGFPNILAAPQLRYDDLSLSAAIRSAGGAFPWLDTVGGTYSTGPQGVCGEVAYSVVPSDGPVQLVGDTLSWSPNLDVAAGDYQYSLVGTLVRYGISSSVDFTVASLPCVAELDVQRIYLNSMTRLWSEDPTTQVFGD